MQTPSSATRLCSKQKKPKKNGCRQRKLITANALSFTPPHPPQAFDVWMNGACSSSSSSCPPARCGETDRQAWETSFPPSRLPVFGAGGPFFFENCIWRQMRWPVAVILFRTTRWTPCNDFGRARRICPCRCPARD